MLSPRASLNITRLAARFLTALGPRRGRRRAGGRHFYVQRGIPGGTATNTGEGPFLASERKAARRLIIQYNRGLWNKEPEILRQADMIEIQPRKNRHPS